MSTLQFGYKNTINLYLTQTLIVNKIYTFVVKVGYTLITSVINIHFSFKNVKYLMFFCNAYA